MCFIVDMVIIYPEQHSKNTGSTTCEVGTKLKTGLFIHLGLW